MLKEVTRDIINDRSFVARIAELYDSNAERRSINLLYAMYRFEKSEKNDETLCYICALISNYFAGYDTKKDTIKMILDTLQRV